MARSQQASSKKQKRKGGGVDFKKIKHKIGRKLPPPPNATNLQFKSKAIILPEQSIASEKSGVAVNRKGLTLLELLKQTTHHNAKIRKDALIGLRDIALKHPSELRLHKVAIIEKLRERISDKDKLVRETLYQLLKSVVFPRLKEDIQGPIVSLIMAYIFNAMTHIAVDIRLMAFKFFDLVVLHYPSSFFLYAEKVLQNHEDILRVNCIDLQDRCRLRDALRGLVHCLSLLGSDKEKRDSLYEQNADMRGPLHAFEYALPKKNPVVSSIFKKLEGLVPILLSCWQEFTPTTMATDSQSFDCLLCIVQSINLAVKFIIEEGINRQQSFHRVSTFSPYVGPEGTKWIESILPVLFKKLLEPFPLSPSCHSTEKEDDQYFMLNVGITEIFLHLSEWVSIYDLTVDKFLTFMENALSWQICSSTRSNKVLREKQLVLLIPFIPRLISHLTGDWIARLLQAFTGFFLGCKADSALNLACLSSIKEMLLPRQRKYVSFSDVSNHGLLHYQITWIRRIPELLLQLDNKHPSVSKIILHLQLHIGQFAPANSALMVEYDNMQRALIEFYCRYSDDNEVHGTVLYGPFMKLPRECQDLAICCLYYFSNFDLLLLKSLVASCLCDDLDPFVVFRIIEVLYSAYKAGHVPITDQISFFITLLTRFKVNGLLPLGMEKYGDKNSNIRTYKAICSVAFSCLSQMGDKALVLPILWKIILNELSHKPSLDNLCAILRLLAILESKPLKLPDESISILVDCLSGYLIDVATLIQENDSGTADSDQMCVFQYYFRPCILLLDRNNTLLTLVLNLLGSFIIPCDSLPPQHGTHDASERSRQNRAIALILIQMHRESRFHHTLSSCKEAIICILQNIVFFQASDEIKHNYEERKKIQNAFDELKIETDRVHFWDADDLKRITVGG